MQITRLDAVLPPAREVPVTVEALVPWVELRAGTWALLSHPTLRYHLEGDVTVHHYIDVRSHFAQDGLVPREAFIRHVRPTLDAARAS